MDVPQVSYHFAGTVALLPGDSKQRSVRARKETSKSHRYPTGPMGRTSIRTGRAECIFGAPRTQGPRGDPGYPEP
jgi:hypothetical protein